jgi:cytochrome c-type biogenesis protein CcmH/NrfG
MTGAFIRRGLAISAVALGLAILAAPAHAQSGQVRGKVVDAQGNPVDGAKVSIQNVETTGRSLETKTNKKGEYIQIGLAPGKYKVTVSKGDLSVTKDVQIHLEMAQLDFTLAPGQAGAPMTKEEAAKQQAKVKAVQQAFTDGVQLSNDGKNEEAIAKFQEVIATVPNCAECYANIGTVYGRMKNYEESEAAYKKAIELKPDFGEAYNGLATVYNAEKKFDLAAEASKKATELTGGTAGAAGGGGGNAAAVFNQGVILWNAGKIPEAQAQFEQAVKLDPNLAEAHYWLGMSLLNAGKTADAKPQFEEYLKLAPTGQYADTAKSIIASIK